MEFVGFVHASPPVILLRFSNGMRLKGAAVSKGLRVLASIALACVLLIAWGAKAAAQSAADSNAPNSPFSQVTPASIPATLPSVPPAGEDQLSRAGRVQVNGFAFKGNKVKSSPELSKVVAEEMKKLNLSDGYLSSIDLESIRTALTKAYIEGGYINSGAVLPDQTIGADRIVTFQIVEGKLSAIHLHAGGQVHNMEAMGATSRPTTLPAETNHAQMNPTVAQPSAPGTAEREPARELPAAKGGINWHLLHDSYITRRVQLGAGPPLNVLVLKDQLELLRRDPNIKTINGELAPGDQPGESILDLTVTEKNPFQIGLEFANSRPPSVGAYEMSVIASDSDLTGDGDPLSARWGVLAGASNTMAYNSDNDISFDYVRPLTPQDLTMELNYTRSSDVVVESPFQSVGITSKTDSISGTLRQPFIRTVEDTNPQINTKDREFDGFLTVSSRFNKTFLLGEPFSFSPGTIDGKQDTFAIRPGLEYVRRSSDEAVSVRTTFSIGVGNVFGSTINHDDAPDSRFFAFLGQAQYAHRLALGNVDLPWYDTQGILRFNTQLTPNRLLTLEQFSLGGMNTVRGYRENQLVTDMAVQASAELQIPVVKSHQKDILSVVPFFDSGYAWNRDNSTTPPALISSVGAGLIFAPTDRVNAQVYWGYRLKHFSHTGHDLQDMGIHFDVTILGF
jgi:hemolysin activation/secretion protein